MNTSSALVLFVVLCCCVTCGRSQPTTTPSSTSTSTSTSTSEMPEVNDNSQMVGGLYSHDPENNTFFDLATIGVGKLDARRGEQCERKISKVVDAQSQETSGTRYVLKAEVCSPAMCDGKQQTPVCDICLLDLWEKKWINFLQVSKFECPIQKDWSYTYSE